MGPFDTAISSAAEGISGGWKFLVLADRIIASLMRLGPTWRSNTATFPARTRCLAGSFFYRKVGISGAFDEGMFGAEGEMSVQPEGVSYWLMEVLRCGRGSRQVEGCIN